MKIVQALCSIIIILQSGIAFAEENKNIQVEKLLEAESSWDGATYTSYPSGKPQISILKITIPPHTKMDWHTHPVPNAAYVLSGELDVQKKDGASRHLKAGDTLAETIGTLHRGITDNSEAVLVVFYAGTKGTPLSEAEKK